MYSPASAYNSSPKSTAPGTLQLDKRENTTSSFLGGDKNVITQQRPTDLAFRCLLHQTHFPPHPPLPPPHPPTPPPHILPGIYPMFASANLVWSWSVVVDPQILTHPPFPIIWKRATRQQTRMKLAEHT